jgi:hypothetical protein
VTDIYRKYKRKHGLSDVVAGFLPWWPEFEPESVHVEFVVDKVALGQVFSEYFCFLPIFSPPIAPQSLSSIIWGWYNRPIVAAVPSGLSLTPLI